ncbi:hypothetical protein [Methylococcus geothermalis]|uniref:Uncharacterized protein n=1 Tax=Methylococcus geothermalis TaxID=2681310 RepID=A0A858QB60_9GAMM|nr:hypothetical protein [Methylococcus geothermalis]QJD31021.1 hypothetical protein GNH96_14420 [Methylococcus geothermalis]
MGQSVSENDSGFSSKAMRILAVVMVVLAVIYFLPAFMSRTSEINGVSKAAAYKSAMKVKRYLSTNDRVIFDTAFGLLDKIKSQEGPDAFAKAVDGMTPEEVIDLARTEVNAKIAAGDPEFKQYASWDDMITKLVDTSLGSSRSRQGGAQQPAPLRQSERPGRPQ